MSSSHVSRAWAGLGIRTFRAAVRTSGLPAASLGLKLTQSFQHVGRDAAIGTGLDQGMEEGFGLGFGFQPMVVGSLGQLG
jgi:hypothetical protein